ncbi:MAG: potassium/proton antiporter [Acidimicrobiales bacterium]|nr:potassium/proton antiporter [Acidimicrobiales bacterium]
MTPEPMIIAAAALLLTGALLSKTSSRFGVPSLLLFMFLGMAAGSEGVLGIEFEDFELASRIGFIALAFILFSGGLGTDWTRIRTVLARGAALATVGVGLSAGVLGAFAALILGFDLVDGLLLGAVIASTDAAAVFSVMRSRGLGVERPLKPLLELESGSNDPAAVFLTVGIIGLINADGPGVAGLAGVFVLQMGLGILIGLVAAKGAVWVINTVRLDYDGIYPVMTVAFVLLVFEGTTWLGGSGFLAAYVAGLTFGNSDVLHKRSLTHFHDAIAWLMQIAMFVVLGLLVFPSDLGPVVLQALAVALVLMFVARPLAVVITLLPFRVPWRHVGFVSWVGLRGATPIILATLPVVEEIEGAETIFNVVFFVVLSSVLIQGSSIPLVARWLGVASDEDEPRGYWIEAALAGDSGHDLHEMVVPPGSAADGVAIVGLHLPADSLIVLIQRGGDVVVPEGRTEINGGDRLLVMADDSTLPEVRSILGVG